MNTEIFEKLDFKYLQEIYIFSNTPLYLVKHFKANDSLKEISRIFSTETLINCFKEEYKNYDKSLLSSVKLYSIIIALVFKNYSEVKDFFDSLEEYDIDWSKELKEILKKLSKINIYSVEDMKNEIKDKYSISNESGKSITFYQIKPKISSGV